MSKVSFWPFSVSGLCAYAVTCQCPSQTSTDTRELNGNTQWSFRNSVFLLFHSLCFALDSRRMLLPARHESVFVFKEAGWPQSLPVSVARGVSADLGVGRGGFPTLVPNLVNRVISPPFAGGTRGVALCLWLHTCRGGLQRSCPARPSITAEAEQTKKDGIVIACIERAT